MAVAQPTGVIEALSAALGSARATLAAFLELVTLETRRAGLALAWMVGCGIAIAVCAAAAWLGIMAALVLWAVALGLPAIAAVLIVALLNLLAGVSLAWACYALSRELTFDATRRQLSGLSPLKSCR